LFLNRKMNFKELEKVLLNLKLQWFYNFKSHSLDLPDKVPKECNLIKICQIQEKAL